MGPATRILSSSARRRGLLAAALVLLADQLTKLWAVAALAPAGAVPVSGFFNLVLVWNRGISFGLFNQGGTASWVFVAVSLAIAAGLLVWLSRTSRPRLALALGLVLGGALGNVIDRLRHGAVVDFLDFHLAGYHWPAFNLADTAIVLGVAVLFLDSLLSPRNRPR